MSKLPPRHERERLLQEKHGKFLHWIEASHAFVARHRAEGFRNFESLDELPALDLGPMEPVHKVSVGIPAVFRGGSPPGLVLDDPARRQSGSDGDSARMKAGFPRYVLRMLAVFVEETYDGQYFLGRNSGTNHLNLFVLRELPNQDVGICWFDLSVDGNLMIVQVYDQAYRRNPQVCPMLDWDFNYMDEMGVDHNEKISFPNTLIGALSLNYNSFFGDKRNIGSWLILESVIALFVFPALFFGVFSMVFPAVLSGVSAALATIGSTIFLFKYRLKSMLRRSVIQPHRAFDKLLGRPSPVFDYLWDGRNHRIADNPDHQIFLQRMLEAFDEVVARIEERFRG